MNKKKKLLRKLVREEVKNLLENMDIRKLQKTVRNLRSVDRIIDVEQPTNPKMMSVGVQVRGIESDEVRSTTVGNLGVENDRRYRKLIKQVKQNIPLDIYSIDNIKTSVDQYDPSKVNITFLKT